MLHWVVQEARGIVLAAFCAQIVSVQLNHAISHVLFLRTQLVKSPAQQKPSFQPNLKHESPQAQSFRMTDQSDDEDWDGLAKLWLRTCEEEHGDDCARQIQPTEVINTLLVDVLDHCLVNATSASRYVALPVDRLPNTLRDAMTF